MTNARSNWKDFGYVGYVGLDRYKGDNMTELSDNIFPQTSELYFPTWERTVSFWTGPNRTGPRWDVETHKAIIKIGENDISICLGIVGKNYKVVSNRDICQTIEAAFLKEFTAEQLFGVQVVDRMSYFGATMIREYLFPGVKCKIGERDVGFRVVVKNGYNGSTGITVYSGAIVFFCSNGQISGEYDMFIAKHSKGFVINRLESFVKGCINTFYKDAERWEQWSRTYMDSGIAATVFDSMPGISEALKKKLLSKYEIEASVYGNTLWAAYNAATYYATHDEGDFKVRDTDSDHTNSTLHDRETRVMRWTQTDEFKKLAGQE